MHHIDPYSETQDNSEDNLLLVCPTHHSTIHTRNTSRAEQKRVRHLWHASVEIAFDYASKGLQFPFGTFQALDYESNPKPAELVEFAPLSVFLGNASDLNFDITGLPGNSQVEVLVSASNNGGESLRSTAIVVQTA